MVLDYMPMDLESHMTQYDDKYPAITRVSYSVVFVFSIISK